MKGMQMEGDRLGHLHQEVMKLKRSVMRSQWLVAALTVLVVILAIALIALGATQGSTIKRLKSRQGLLPNPNVTFATRTGDRKVNDLTYGGSLFRGSGFWAAKRSLEAALTDHVAIGYNDVVYILGGAKGDGNLTSEVWKYDSVFHNYTFMAPMPEPRYRFGAAIIENTIYVVGGRNVSDNLEAQPNDGMVKTTLIYDIVTNTWRKGTDALDFQGDTCAAALDGKIYMVGGYGVNYSYLNTTAVYDPATNSWSRLPDMPTPRGDLMCASLNGEIYVLGGYYDPTGDRPNSFSAKMESFNPTTGAVVALEGGRIILVGGEGHYREEDGYKYPKHVNEVYYASDQTWVQKAMMTTARFRTAAATAGGLTFVFGGADVCIQQPICPALDQNEVFLDVDHPHVYIYLKNEAYNDNAALTRYPL
ncbi:hypothetical protein GOP47_0023361 [Adiantum capillus-veneris]|uniref:Uncharacterized protein n=1 Tax=Adiantum capillus-veneris TaxID=13818 RepID=A0A9D4U5Y1_ADICA|nr:hypothetical protein GOP47_0023361 [Adiantum capillus-veneris]